MGGPVSVLVNRGNDGTEESIYRVSPSYQEMHQQQHGKRGSICQEFWIFLTRFLDNITLDSPHDDLTDSINLKFDILGTTSYSDHGRLLSVH